jgi:hypothetical protein
MASEFEMRVGHAERDAVTAELREHYAAGRLTLEELNERLDKALAAKTRGDLNALMTDLPFASAAGTGRGAGSRTGAGARSTAGSGFTAGPAASTGIGSGSGGPSGGSGSRNAGRAFAAVLSGLIAVAALAAIGGLAVSGSGAGRPLGIVLILAALALLRRILFGRRRGRGCRSRCRW